MINATFLICLLFFWACHLINLLKLKQNLLHQKRLFQIGTDIIWANRFTQMKCNQKQTRVKPNHEQARVKLINPLTPWAFCKKMRFLDILMVFRLDLGQISFNLVENAFATRQLASLATGIAFYDIWTRVCAEIKILRKWPTSLVFSSFGIFFAPSSFFSFSFLFAAVIALLLGLLAVKKLLRKHHRDRQFYHGAARCSGRKFCSEFFTQLLSIFVHI